MIFEDNKLYINLHFLLQLIVVNVVIYLLPPFSLFYVDIVNHLQKPSIKAKGDIYSAFAIFKNEQEAQLAYEKLKGTQEEVETINILYLPLSRIAGTYIFCLFIQVMRLIVIIKSIVSFIKDLGLF